MQKWMRVKKEKKRKGWVETELMKKKRSNWMRADVKRVERYQKGRVRIAYILTLTVLNIVITIILPILFPLFSHFLPLFERRRRRRS
jgi:type IV secretory pathway component VirB8